jgi:hypothetical protein
MPKALRAEINDVVVKHAERKLRKDGTLDVAVMAHEMTQSLIDMIVDHAAPSGPVGQADRGHGRQKTVLAKNEGDKNHRC